MNYLLILGVAILQTIIGALWYSPLLFGKFWMKANGLPENISKKEMQELSKGVGKYYGIQFALTILSDFILFSILQWYLNVSKMYISSQLNTDFPDLDFRHTWLNIPYTRPTLSYGIDY
jgi:Protein of unknown function (DUF1761)